MTHHRQPQHQHHLFPQSYGFEDTADQQGDGGYYAGEGGPGPSTFISTTPISPPGSHGYQHPQGSFNVVPQAPMSGPRRGGPARPTAAGGVRPQQPQPQQPLFSDIGQGDFLNNVAQITDNPLLRVGLDQGSRWAEDAGRKGLEGITRYLEATNLKYYFNINNSYVPNKLKVILCPILHKSWTRRITQTPDGKEQYLPPKDDLNAPDLYIPLMAFVTYVLLAAFVLGTRNEFTPEMLGKLASSGLISLGFEVVFLKFGFYLLNSMNCSVFDLLSYAGYIFISLCVNHLVGLLLGTYAYYCSVVLTGVFIAIFMVRTLRLLILPDQEMANTPLASSKRSYFLLSVAVLQLVMSYFLGVCK
ncbi:Yip1 domain containing protein [Acanthamoeba castellanii str. Neff]|uniref:Protein YIF1 n=1 Tax=Acanthamoeba castellanii (strain ATCC 30010 / Neff) TaxID=1257118 RepID=L8GN09_ACACF|nr:Yip1 domain containing protein [Acanthamoeba castellanii str. Neff]ELR13596.1 Yip1 domain containing protein [Acanthamoeba castellanii str. Neff]